MAELRVDTHKISVITARNRIIQAIYNGGRVVWEAVRSCFGGGMWIPFKPWLYDEGWRSNKKR